MELPPSVRPSVRLFQVIFRTDLGLPFTLTFSMRVGRDHGLQGLKVKVKVKCSVRNVVGGTSILDGGQFSSFYVRS